MNTLVSRKICRERNQKKNLVYVFFGLSFSFWLRFRFRSISVIALNDNYHIFYLVVINYWDVRVCLLNWFVIQTVRTLYAVKRNLKNHSSEVRFIYHLLNVELTDHQIDRLEWYLQTRWGCFCLIVFNEDLLLILFELISFSLHIIFIFLERPRWIK